jgi:hypothetical protein
MPFQKIRRMIRSSDLRPDLPQTPDSDIEAFVSHYVVAALWMETDGDGTSLDSLYGPADLSEDASRQCVDECIDFLRQSLGGSDVATALSTLRSTGKEGSPSHPDGIFAQAGHDFWLTRNGHGTGFWDRPEIYGDREANALSEISRQADLRDLDVDSGTGEIHVIQTPRAIAPRA